MFARQVIMLAVLAITVVTAVTSGHAARMSIEPDHAVHVGDMMHAPENSDLTCDGEPHCGSTDTAMCEFVCAGLPAFLTLPNGEAGPDYLPASHELPSVATLANMASGLHERPQIPSPLIASKPSLRRSIPLEATGRDVPRRRP